MNNKSRHEILFERYRRIVSDRTTHSDQPLHAFCRSHKISVWAYYYWKKKVSRDPAPCAPLKVQQPFLPIAISHQEVQSTGYEICFGKNTRLSLTPGFNKDEIATIIDLLLAKVS
jgi:hypothetical protein